MSKKIHELLRFKKELYFDGAVQIDWVHDSKRREQVASSFVFHGPEYFGVTEDDIVYKNHRLIDTASFVKIITEKLYGEQTGSSFVLTIAPYGTGKSHLGVTLASLFSRTDQVHRKVLDNLAKVDKHIGTEISNQDHKPNLVLTLNGMRDFNLNYEILNAAQKSLNEHHTEIDFLKGLTKSYDIAKQFLLNSFDSFKEEFIEASKVYFDVKDVELKNYLVERILTDANVFEIINTVYQKVTGTYIRWDEGISAGDILLKLSETLCGERGVFNKILVLFDEFGRYIEYAASFPSRAGDSALQQIYEAVQNSDNQVVFVGFIQSDLKTYLTRVERTANIHRYVGRYEASEKVHLSSNLETIFANLIERKEPQAFHDLVVSRLRDPNEEGKWKQFHRHILDWIPQAQQSGVWKEWSHFSKVILEGTYPLHPLTTWMLANLSAWLQQRSSLTFLDTQLKNYADQSVKEFGDLPIIPATSIVLSDFFQELLAAEQDGRQQSEYCIRYHQINIKYKDKFNARQQNVLAANLILRIGRLKTKTRDNVLQALSYAAGMDLNEVKKCVSQLENDFGVISYDEAAGCFDFIADATGINDFKFLLSNKKRQLQLNLDIALDGRIKELLNISNTIDTMFGQKHHIRTLEWRYTQEIKPIESIDDQYLNFLMKEWKLSTSTDKPKGRVIWVYSNSKTTQEQIEKLQSMLKKYRLSTMPIRFFLLDDKEDTFYYSLVDYHIAHGFTEEEKMKYARFIPEYIKKVESIVLDRFNDMVSSRYIITETGVQTITERPTMYLNRVFEEIYEKAIPFPFDGFMNKTITIAKKSLYSVARIMLSKADYQIIHSQSTDVKNRIEAVLFEKRPGSWGVINSTYQLMSPTNVKVRTIFNELDDLITTEKPTTLEEIFEIYQRPPYGINDYALALLIACYLAQRSLELRVLFEGERIKLIEWGNNVFEDKQKGFTRLLKSKIVKVNPENSATRFIQLYQKVEQNNDVNLCPDLWKEFNTLQNQEEIPEELKDKAYSMKLILEEGMKLYTRAKEFFGKQQHKLDEAKKQMDYKQLFEIIEECAPIEGFIGDSTRYVYNASQVSQAELIGFEAQKVIETTFDTWLLKHCRCEAVGQLTAFEKWVKHVIDSFQRHGYTEYAQKTRSKLLSITDNLEIVKKLQNLSSITKDFLRRTNPDSKTLYDQLTVWKSEGQSLLEIIRSEKVSEQDRKQYEKQVVDRIQQIEHFINEVKERVTRIYDQCFDTTTLDQCKKLLDSISSVLTQSIHERDKEGLIQLANDIQNFLNDVEELNKLQDNRSEIFIELGHLREKWSEIESDVAFGDVIESIGENYKIILNIKEDKWKSKYLRSKDEIKQLTSGECVKWLNETEELPNFLTMEVQEEFQKNLIEVKNRMNQLKVEGVISLFNNLTDEQKETCYQLISQQMKLQHS